MSEPGMAGQSINFYQEISLIIPSADVEPVTNYVIDNICGGLVLEDEDNSSETTIKFYISEHDDISDKIIGLRNFLDTALPHLPKIEISSKKIGNLDWEEAYRKSVTPVEVGESIVIKPPWCKDIFDGKIEILLEPKMAFGTGRHETTRGSLAMLESIDIDAAAMLDLGCGSGILGIYAAKRGAIEVLGYDIDPLAVENSRENYDLNKVDNICRSELGSIDAVNNQKQFDLVVVNIIKSVIVPIVGELKRHTLPGGKIILSGLLLQDRIDIDRALESHELKEYTTRNDNGWLTYLVWVP